MSFATARSRRTEARLSRDHQGRPLIVLSRRMLGGCRGKGIPKSEEVLDTYATGREARTACVWMELHLDRLPQPLRARPCTRPISEAVFDLVGTQRHKEQNSELKRIVQHTHEAHDRSHLYTSQNMADKNPAGERTDTENKDRPKACAQGTDEGSLLGEVARTQTIPSNRNLAGKSRIERPL